MIQQPNFAQLPQTLPQNGANAVSINIYNPQAYGSSPQQAPYAYTNSFYQLPEAQIYKQPVYTEQKANPVAYPQYVPAQIPQAQTYQPVIAPAPQLMPDSVLPETNNTQEVKPEPVEVVSEDKDSNTPEINIDDLVRDLNSTDNEVKAQSIYKIAEYAQDKPEIALQVVAEPVMQGLVNVINEDTTGLEGPTDRQIEIAEKISKGEPLTPEEDAISEQLSPRDKVNKNRIFALYTLAMLQKLQRDELNQYNETRIQNGEKPVSNLELTDLIGFDAIQDIIKNDSRPEVKVAAIQALEYVAEPSEKQAVSEILADSLKSKDEPVRLAAEEAIAKFA